MTSNFSRREAEAQLKETAADASYHSSGDVLNTAASDSKYAHGAMERTGSVDGNTALPSTNTTVDGAYAIGHTSTANTVENYDNKFTTPATHSIGNGSRSVQQLPEEVHDLGSTVQTQKTTHVITTESQPTKTTAYIPPSSGATYTTGTAGQAYTTTGTSGLSSSQGQYDTSNTSSDARNLSNELGHGNTSSSSKHAHHGIIGNNTTIQPAENAQYNLNAVSGAALGTSAMGIPHSTTTAHNSTTTSSTGGHGVSGAAHKAEHNVESTGTHNEPKKEGMMAKIKHAFHK